MQIQHTYYVQLDYFSVPDQTYHLAHQYKSDIFQTYV